MRMYADEWTDERLAQLEKRITRVYRQASKELTATGNAYWKHFEERYQQELKAYHDGKYTEQQFRDWYKAQVARGKHWEKMRDNAAERITQANQIAADYINDEMPGIFAFNHNAEIAAAINAGYASIGMSFEMYDENTVKWLLKDQPDLLPEAKIDIPKDKRWNRKKLTEAVVSATIQGKSPSQLADSLQEITGMNRTSAIRNARSMTTTAENGGRQKSYDDLASFGINVKKQWIATLDSRTRESHREVDGEIVDRKDTFSNGLMYPGDRSGDPSEWYNCRCTMGGVLDENSGKKAVTYRGKNAETAYEDGTAIKSTISKLKSTGKTTADKRDNLQSIAKGNKIKQRRENGFSCYPTDESGKILTKSFKNLTPEEGFYDIGMHGATDSVAYGSSGANMSPHMLAEMIKHEDGWNGQNIRLMACNTGKQVDGEYCFAEELSNSLGVKVKAPDDYLFMREDGSFYVGYDGNGAMRTFSPNERGRYK